MTCIKMGSDESHFNVSLIVRDSHKTMSTNHNFWRERRAKAVSNRSPSAYQPNALTLGQTGCHQTSVTAVADEGPSQSCVSMASGRLVSWRKSTLLFVLLPYCWVWWVCTTGSASRSKPSHTSLGKPLEMLQNIVLMCVNTLVSSINIMQMHFDELWCTILGLPKKLILKKKVRNSHKKDIILKINIIFSTYYHCNGKENMQPP